MSLTNGSLQVLPWKNDTNIEKNGWPQVTSSNNRLLSVCTYLKPGGIMISNYDISLPQFLFCKNTVNLKECVVAFALLFCYSSNGWLQLELRINSIPLQKVLFSKKGRTRENTKSLQKASWNDDDTIQIYGCKCSFEITIHLK